MVLLWSAALFTKNIAGAIQKNKRIIHQKNRIVKVSNSDKGIIIAIGGNEEKGLYNKELDYSSVLGNFVSQTEFKSKSKILIIPSASAHQEEASKNYQNAFAKLGCVYVETLFINAREEADSQKNIDALNSSHAIIFTGGDQSKIVSAFSGTEFLRRLKQKHRLEKYVIAGTSAGSMAMSGSMIAGGVIDTNTLFKGSVRYGEGLSFLSDIIIDTHFIKRGRFGRLVEAVSLNKEKIGIGVAEDTAIVIKKRKLFVIGTGMVIIFDPKKTKGGVKSNHSISGMRVHVLSSGDRFCIKKRKVFFNAE